MRTGWLHLSIASAALASGCQVLAGIEERSQTRFPQDAGAEAHAADGGLGDGANCGTMLPAAPDASYSTDGGDLSFTVAVRTFDLASGYSQRALDLDGVVTPCEDAGATGLSCSPPALGPDTCDEPCGGDHGGNGLLALAEQATHAVEAQQEQLRRGNIGLLFRVRNFNGAIDDQDVLVDVFLSGGTCRCIDSLLGCEVFDAGTDNCWVEGSGARWDGTDEWVPVEGSSYLSNQEVFSKSRLRGYVSQGVLVARQDPAAVDDRLRIPMGTKDRRALVLPLTRAILTATVEQGDHGWNLSQGRLAGAASAADLLALLAAMGHCNDLVWTEFMSAMCERRDLMASSSRDFQGLPCDALALGLAFTAQDANILPNLLPASALAAAPCEAGPEPCP